MDQGQVNMQVRPDAGFMLAGGLAVAQRRLIKRQICDGVLIVCGGVCRRVASPRASCDQHCVSLNHPH